MPNTQDILMGSRMGGAALAPSPNPTCEKLDGSAKGSAPMLVYSDARAW